MPFNDAKVQAPKQEIFISALDLELLNLAVDRLRP
jgi:hypothetical protein